MEYETKFYFSKEDLEKIVNILNGIPDLHSNCRIYEKVIEYKSTEGKLRLKISHNSLNNKCKLSWKNRLSNNNGIKIEEEKNVRINPDDIDNMIYLLENVWHFESISSYERYRLIFENNDIEISVDEYPFGICLEIENKSIEKEPEKIIAYWIKRIGLDIASSDNKTRDEKYHELCQEQKIKVQKEVFFDKKMPKIKNKLTISNSIQEE